MRNTEISSDLLCPEVISILVSLSEKRGRTGCSNALWKLEKQSYSLRITMNKSSGSSLNVLDI